MWSVHAKRKEPEEIVVELLRNVSLSPPKRVRVSDSWTPPNSWPTRSFEPLVEVQETPPQADPLIYDQVTPSSSPSPLPPPTSPVVTATRESGTDEKAIILYMGVNPPLFPGGPPTGSLEPLLIVDTSGALATYKGTGNNGSTVDVGHASSAFNNSSSDANIWTGLFEALDLHGNKPLLPIRKLQRTSSCSSLPQVPSSMDDSSMDESDAERSASQLALIPYSPPLFPLTAANGGVQSSKTATDFPGADLNEEMTDDGDAMDVMEESMPADGVATESGTQFGSPIPTFGSAQWEPCDMFKAPYSKVMWSH